MKLSLILEAIDRMSSPARAAQGSVAQLTGGMKGAAAAAMPATRAIGATAAATDRLTGPARQATKETHDLAGGLATVTAHAAPAMRSIEGVRTMAGRLPAAFQRAGAAAKRLAGAELQTLKGALHGAEAAASGLLRRLALLGASALGKGIRATLSAVKWGAIGGVAGAGAGIGMFLRGMVENAAKFEQYQVALEGTEHSATKAKAAMAWVAQFAQTTPYEIDEVTKAFVRARGIGIDPMSGAFRTLGDAAGSTNNSLMDAVEMLADAQTGEYERLKSFNITTSVKGQMVTFSYLDKAGKNASVSVKKSIAGVRNALIGIMDSNYAGGMARQAKTLTGVWRNLLDFVTVFQLKVAQAGIFDRIKGGLNAVLDWTVRITKSGQIDEWAKRVSGWLTRLWDQAELFIHGTTWSDVSAGISGVIGTMVTLVEWLGKAVRLWERLNELSGHVDATTGFDNGQNSLEGKAWKVLSWDPIGDGLAKWWDQKPPAGTPVGKPAVDTAGRQRKPGRANPYLRSPGLPPPLLRRPGLPSIGGPGGASAVPRDPWRLAPSTGPLRRLSAAPASRLDVRVQQAKPAKVSVDINLRGPGAPSASVQRLRSSSPDLNATVNRGGAMAGPA